jgi:hypothetical protein
MVKAIGVLAVQIGAAFVIGAFCLASLLVFAWVANG